jgi:hypothetical protein
MQEEMNVSLDELMLSIFFYLTVKAGGRVTINKDEFTNFTKKTVDVSYGTAVDNEDYFIVEVKEKVEAE